MITLHAVDSKYCCTVRNTLNIDSSEKAQIEAISGNHISGKTNDDEIYFWINSNGDVKYFPRGLENFYKNLKGILIIGTSIKEFHQEELKPFDKLEYFQLSTSSFEIVEEGLFDFNPNLETIIFRS